MTQTLWRTPPSHTPLHSPLASNPSFLLAHPLPSRSPFFLASPLLKTSRWAYPTCPRVTSQPNVSKRRPRRRMRTDLSRRCLRGDAADAGVDPASPDFAAKLACLAGPMTSAWSACHAPLAILHNACADATHRTSYRCHASDPPLLRFHPPLADAADPSPPFTLADAQSPGPSRVSGTRPSPAHRCRAPSSLEVSASVSASPARSFATRRFSSSTR